MKKQVIVKLKGGMGNQMFQYAFGKSLEAKAKQTGNPITLLFDTTAYTDPNKKDTRRPYMLPLLNTHATVADNAVALRARNPLGIVSQVIRKVRQKLHLENIVTFEPTLLQPPYHNYYEGYWQTEKYFMDIRDNIRTEFTLSSPMGTAAQTMHDRIQSDPTAVSIFFRRTDYVGNTTFDIGEQEYQQRAINRIGELFPEFTLYVMSDDIDWVKEHADLPAGSVFVSSTDIPPEEEMMLAAACRHQIIPNSTFAWWGAYLNQNPEKIVIAPKDWVREDKHNEYANITPEEWLRV